MARLNDCKFIGNVGRDPVVKVFTGGSKIATTNLAVTEKWKDRAGNPQEHTEWVSLVFNDGVAEVAEKFIKKGDCIYVAGKLRTRTYTGADNVQKWVTEIVVRDLQLLGGKKENAAPGSQAVPVEVAVDPDQDLPF